MLGATVGGLRALAVTQSPADEDMPMILNGALENDREAEDPLAAYTDEQLDSIRMAKLQAEFDAVQSAYRSVRMLKNDPSTTEAALYPEVYRAYTMTTYYLDKLDGDDSRRRQTLAVLRDLDSELQYGAYFYSGQNDAANMAKFARAYIDIQLLDDMKGENWRRDANFPNVVYICASDAYNHKEFDKAIDYFKLYFTTGDETHREKVYMFMGQAAINAKKYDLAVASMSEGARIYSTNRHIVSLGLQACIDGGYGERISEFLDKALVLSPDDESLLNIKARLLEDEGDYQSAIDVYSRLDQMKPNNLKITQRLAMAYYNMGVTNYNKAIMETEEKVARKYNRQAKDYFNGAAELLRTVIANNPTSVKYLTALAVAYNCLDNKAAFDQTNSQITALGGAPVADLYMPPVMTVNDGNAANYERSGTATASSLGDVPTYADFAAEYVGTRLKKWGEKGEFERQEAYKARVNEASIKAEFDKLNKEASAEYLRRYTTQLRINDLQLQPYDSENEVFRIDSSYGPILLRVPMSNGEAELFKSSWNQVHFNSPKYYIDPQGQVRLGQLNFTTPQGKTYAFNDAQGLSYGPPVAVVNYSEILQDAVAKPSMASAAHSGGNTTVIGRESDVDKNIPQNDKRFDNSIALIIANEDYTQVPKVASARHDGDIFRRYCIETLGVPESNVRYYPNATLGNMYVAVNDLKNLVNALNGNANVIVYYAGHGIPDEHTKDAYLLPVDGNALVSATGYSLDRLYKELGEMGANSVSVFLDACFSGSNRDGGALASARAVAIAPKEASPKGNMFTLSATSNQETALPYTEKNHGMFTYFLLKKLQESKGNCTLKELSDYVINNVKLESNRVNRKQQTPTVSLSGSMIDGYTKTKLRH